MANKILVVDDDLAVQVTLQEILEDEGHEVVTASDGYEAIQLAWDNTISLIFMDFRMPGLNGVETYFAIKELLPECVVVIITGYAIESLIEQGLEQGIREVLQKPASIERLLEIVDAVMPKSPKSSDLPSSVEP